MHALKTTGSIVDVPGVRVGHATDVLKHTGCSVVIFDEGAVCGVDVRGGSPGTRETELLKPENSIEKIHGLLLSGGSAYGLNAAAGVMQYLEENSIGFKTDYGVVPCVPAAVIFDLNFGLPSRRPDLAMGYRAAKASSRLQFRSGNTGAGCGATVGKLAGFDKAMKGGLGTASTVSQDGLVVAAMVVVNSVGEIRDPSTGKILAGAYDSQGQFIDLARWPFSCDGSQNLAGSNTTLGIICTNATLNKAQMTKISQMAHDGMARTIYPVHTTFDGDTIFSATTGGIQSDVNTVGVLAANMISAAIVDAIVHAENHMGVPAYKDNLFKF